MKKILIALVLVASLLVVSACGSTDSDTSEAAVSPADTSASDASATDASATDVSAIDAVSAPEGFTGCVIDELYFCYPDSYTVALSDSDALSVIADSDTGASFSVSKHSASEMDISHVSKTDLDVIGENSVAELEASLGDSVEVEYTYKNHGSVAEGAGVYFAFELKITYTELDFSQNLSYYQLYIVNDGDLYIATFAVNTLTDNSDAETYFAQTIESIELLAE